MENRVRGDKGKCKRRERKTRKRWEGGEEIEGVELIHNVACINFISVDKHSLFLRLNFAILSVLNN